MPSKKTKSGRDYEIDGKRFVWHPLDDNDEAGNQPDVTIPLRLKLGVLREMSGRDLDTSAMFDLLERIIPSQAAALDEMDVNDFQEMFEAWQDEYTSLQGATLGE